MATISVWWIDLDATLPADFERHLVADELARSARFAFGELRRRYLNGRLAMRALLARALGCRPQDVPLVTNAHGKPLIESRELPGFNLSNARGVGVLAIDLDGPIGVDLELHHAVAERASLAVQHFDTTEQAILAASASAERDTVFLRGWTRKEACLKAWGSGLGDIDTRRLHTGLHPVPRTILPPPEAKLPAVQVTSVVPDVASAGELRERCPIADAQLAIATVHDIGAVSQCAYSHARAFGR